MPVDLAILQVVGRSRSVGHRSNEGKCYFLAVEYVRYEMTYTF